MALERSEIHKAIGKKVTLQFTAVTDSKAIKGGKISLIAKSQGVPVRVIGFGTSYLPSAKFWATGKLYESKEPRVAALFITWQKLKPISEANWWQRNLGEIRAGLRGAAKDSPLIPGMVLGDTSLQSANFNEAMRRAGLTHLTAVSGANFAIVSSFVLWLMKYPIRNLRLRLFVTAMILLAFIGLVRPSPSVLRAAAMAAVVIFAKSHKQRSDSLPSLGFAIALVIIADPWQARDPGFALSVLATAGLLLIAPRLKLPKWLAEPLAATALCTPIIVGLSGYLSFVSIIANVLAAPLVAPVTILGFIAALLPPVAPIIIPIAKIPASLITKIAYQAADFPVVQMNSAFVVISLAAIFYLGRKQLLIILLIVLFLTHLQRWPNNDWQIANCDVGQGDALVIKSAPGEAILVDVGPDSKLIDQCLKSLSISRLPLIILTHSHMDHVGGLSGAIKNREVGEVLQQALRGQVIKVRELRIEILWPDGREYKFADNGGEGSAVNNQSIVALIKAPDYSLLTTGDIEPDVQELIKDYLPNDSIDYLKVAHHGSKYQSRAFNQRVNPRIAMVSVGVGNRYGHPAPGTLASFGRVYRTDKDGALAFDPISGSVSSSKVGVFGLPILWRVA